MLTIALIFFTIAMLSYLWLIVEGFKEHVLWGIGILLVPFVPLIFTIMHWQRAKKPFLINVVSTILIVVVLFEPMSTAMVESVKIAERIQNGEITEQQGQELMQQNMMQILSGNSAPTISDEDLMTPEEIRIESLRAELEEKNRHARESQVYAEEQAKKVEIKEEQLRQVNIFTPIKVSQVKKYVGKRLRVVSFEGIERQGILRSAGYDRLTLDRKLAGGQFNFDILIKDIKTLEVQKTVLK